MADSPQRQVLQGISVATVQVEVAVGRECLAANHGFAANRREAGHSNGMLRFARAVRSRGRVLGFEQELGCDSRVAV